MRRSVLPTLLSWTVMLLTVGMPVVAHACPMCFAGGDQNQGAFLAGSIFLMVVPVLALGGLGLWAYRRLKANDDLARRPDAEAKGLPQHGGASGVVLQISSRR